LIYVIALSAPGIVLSQLLDPGTVIRGDVSPTQALILQLSAPFLTLVCFALLFSTARRRNGYAGVHEHLSRTRVVQKVAREARAVVRQTLQPVPAAAGARRVGPFQLVDEADDSPAALAYDDRLRRNVWIRFEPDNAPAVSAARRDISRPGRLRWLVGRRQPGDSWDAFEAVGGQPLAEARRRHPWKTVRHWVSDLAAELAAGQQDGSTRALGLDRVWIAGDGRAVLLDWPAARPQGARDPSATAPMSHAEAQRFLRQVAAAGITGAADGPLREPLPLGARALLAALDRGTFESPAAAAAEAARVERQPAAIARWRRAAQLTACALPPVFLFGAILLVLTIGAGWMRGNEDLMQLTGLLEDLSDMEERAVPAQASERAALETYIAGSFRRRIDDPATWSGAFPPLSMDGRMRKVATAAVSAHPTPTETEVAQARAAIQPILDEQAREILALTGPGRFGSALRTAVGSLAFVALLGLLSAAIFRGGLILRAFGMAVVRATGEPASRIRAFWRALLAWTPAVLGGLATMTPWLELPTAAAAAIVSVMLAGAVWAVIRPDRGIQDWLAGTRLVPR
jgi:hypothetical protein